MSFSTSFEKLWKQPKQQQPKQQQEQQQQQ
jgi:hypothetical protein